MEIKFAWFIAVLSLVFIAEVWGLIVHENQGKQLKDGLKWLK